MQKTLLLCYPDDFENQGKSLAAECLQMLQSDFVVHCGELIGDTSSLDHAPWGRTTGASAQQHLFSLFRYALVLLSPEGYLFSVTACTVVVLGNLTC